MSKVVDVPGTGVVEFPDSMSDDDIAGVLKGHVSEQVAPPPDSLRVAPGFKVPPIQLNEKTISTAVARPQPDTSDSLREQIGQTSPSAVVWRALNYPLVRLIPESVRKNPIVEGAGRIADVATGKGIVSEIARLTKSKAAEGVSAGTESMAESMTSPIGIATLGMGSLPRMAQKAISLAFAAKMASEVPDIAKQLGEEFARPEGQRDEKKIAQLLTEAAGQVGFASIAGAHGLSPKPKGVPNASRIPETAEVHGNMRPQPVKGPGKLPVEEGVPGVQPQAVGGIPEAPKSEIPLAIRTIGQMDPEQFNAAIKASGTGLTEMAYKTGEGVTTEDIPALEAAQKEAHVQRKKLLEDPKTGEEAENPTIEQMQRSVTMGMKGQFFGEAIKWRKALDEALSTNPSMISDYGEIEKKYGVGGMNRGEELYKAVQRERAKSAGKTQPEQVQSPAQTPPPKNAPAPVPEIEEVTPLDPQTGNPISPTDQLINKLEAKPTAPEQSPELISMGADTYKTPEDFNWIEEDPNIVRKTGLQSFIEKNAQNPSDSWNNLVTRGIPVARALKEYFRGQEKGGAAGRKAATEELKMADRWLEADANNIRKSLTKLVTESLPVSERGRFITAIANATKRPPLTTGDPEAMYRNAAQVAARIEDRAHEFRKETTIDEIKKTVGKAVASPSVDVQYKQKITDAIKRLGFTKLTSATKARLESTREYAQTSGVESLPDAVVAELDLLNKINAKDLPLNVLEAIRDRVQLLEKLGRLKVKTRQAVWEAEKGDLVEQMQSGESVKMEEHPELRPQPGEKASFGLRLRNFINRRQNNLANIDRGVSPRDVLMDLMDGAKGGYRGFMSRTFGGRIDSAFNRMLVRWKASIDPIQKYGNEQKFSEQDYERIGTYAVLKQEGGRERLIENGASPEILKAIESSIKPNELEMYRRMRKMMDETLPAVKDLMRNLYNIDVQQVKDYFPMQREWRLFEPKVGQREIKAGKGEDVDYDELATWKNLEQDYVPRRTTQAEKGFTKERLPDAKTAVKIHALDIFNRHMQDVSHLLETQRDIKMLGETARNEAFSKTYGNIGQKFTLDWLDTVARQGGTEAFRRIAALDTLRRNTTLGVLGLRPSSQLVHLANIPLAWNQIGGGNIAKGMAYYAPAFRDVLTLRGQNFLKKNFAETYARAGAEPAIDESSAANLLGIPIGKLSGPAFLVVKEIDRINSQTTALAVYKRLLAEKGIDPDTYAEHPIDEQARNEALIRARRAVASPLPKDVPQALSRGSITGGNVSVGRALFQFQNTMLDQWSNLRHDFYRAGIKEKNPKIAAGTAAAFVLMLLAETGIKHTVTKIIEGSTGYKPRHPENYEKRAAIEALRRFPFMGNLLAAAMYSESGVPAIDALIQIAKAAKTAITAKTQKSREKAVIQATSGALQMMGMPGASFAGEVVEKAHQ